MRQSKPFLLGLLLSATLAAPLEAQTRFPLTSDTPSGGLSGAYALGVFLVDPVTKLPVSAGGGSSTAPFASSSAYAGPLAVSTTSSRIALPAGAAIVVYNTGTSPAYVQFGGSAVAATTANDVIQPGSAAGFAAGTATYLAAITASGTATLNISGGAGLPTGWGGGQVGGATAANQSTQITAEQQTATALGAPADAAWTSGSGGVNALLKAVDRDLLAGTVPTGTLQAPATGSATLNVQNPPLTTQHSTAREACHVFTKGASTSGLQTLTAEATSASTLYVQIFDLAAAPTSATNQGANLLYHYPVGSNGTVAGAAFDFTGRPIASTNGFVACLSSTDAPTYTAISAVGWYEGQVP